ncbi:MAG TPA: hypothetical protein VHV77_11880, partial [Pirellulales bacterium]|nr:hypothetical protein [Pirellulales bacterium]
MAKGKQKPLDDDYETPRFSSTAGARGHNHWKLKLLAVLTVLVASLVALAPTIVFDTPLGEHLLASATGNLNGTLKLREISFGWITPLEIVDAELCDEKGNVVVKVPRVAGTKSLLGLVGWPLDFGEIRIESPHADIELRDGGSNVEDVLANYLTGPSQPSQLTVGGTVAVTDAVVVVHDIAAQKSWNIQPLAASAKLPITPNQTIELSAEGAIVDAEKRPAPFSLKLQSDRLVLKTQDFPLAITQALARRAVAGAQLDGRLQTDVSCQWQQHDGKLRRTLDGRLAIDGLAAACGVSGSEQLRLASLVVPCHIAWEGDKLCIDQLELNCDVGKITCQGTIGDPLHAFEAGAMNGLASIVAGGNAQLTAQLDLAKVAQLLPNTLHIRSGGIVRSGAVNLQLSTQANGTGAV